MASNSGWVIVNGVLQFTGAMNVLGTLTLSSSAASTVTLSNPSNNNLTITGDLTSSGGSVYVADAGVHGWQTRSLIESTADGRVTLENHAGSAGTGLDMTTDATFKIRTRAFADTAIVDVSRYSAGGTLGVVTFGPAAVASITVKGGIITAIS